MTDDGGELRLVKQLVLENEALKQQQRVVLGESARLIVALMGRFKTKKITPAMWAKAEGVSVVMDDDDDGGKVVRVIEPAEVADGAV